MTMKIVDRDRRKDKVNGREDIREQRSQNFGRVVYVAIELLMSDHTSNAGENDWDRKLCKK